MQSLEGFTLRCFVLNRNLKIVERENQERLQRLRGKNCGKNNRKNVVDSQDEKGIIKKHETNYGGSKKFTTGRDRIIEEIKESFSSFYSTKATQEYSPPERGGQQTMRKPGT